MHPFPHRHLTGIFGLQPWEINFLLDEAEQWITLNRSKSKHDDRLAGLTLINAFFENSTRTLPLVRDRGESGWAPTSSTWASPRQREKGRDADRHRHDAERHAPRRDRHPPRGIRARSQLIADKVDCPVLNAGDGRHEHPTQALLDALTIRRRKGRIAGLTRRHLRRCPAQPRRAVEHPRADRAGRGGARGRAADADARRSRTVGRHPFHDIDAGLEGRRRGDDAAPPARADGRRLRPVAREYLRSTA
jgi:aspartate carbamoyltransferase catalytic subunit